MKKYISLIFVFILLLSCSEIIYDNEAKINFDVYATAFVFNIVNEKPAFPLQGYEGNALNHFVNKLEKVSGFTAIYDEDDFPQMADSVDLKIILTITNFSTDKYYDEDEEADYYKSKVKVNCRGVDRANRSIFDFTRKGEVKEEVEDMFSYYENDRKALTEALDEISIYFLKSFKI